MELDYKKIGLKVGLEVHQMLDSHKLFCRCPSELCDKLPDYTLTRRLRSVIGETGELDIAASHEHTKQLTFIYEGFHNSTCQIEADMEPPMPINQEALGIALQISLMLNSSIIDQIQVMRKTVIDGSNTTGFQRTALIAMDGHLRTTEGVVTIPTISIEEDACRIIKQDRDTVTYRLDRLGIPLIEIGTGPDLRTPSQVKEAAEALGMILRSTGKVKRGLGTIRQDVNVSITGGERIEIKGAQDLRLIPKLVEFECQRQLSLLELKKILSKSCIQNKKIDISTLMEKSGSKIFQNTLNNNGIILALKLPRFKSYLGREIQPGRRLGTELSDYSKKAGVGGLFHSDELPKYGITQEDVNNINKTLECKETDAFIIVADQPRKAESAIDIVIERANYISNGIPKEVRKANPDGTSSYLRPMPGSARLYPETDLLPIIPDTKGIKLPELLIDKAARISKKLKLSKDLALTLSKSPQFEYFEKCIKKYKNIKPAFIAELILTAPKQVQKQFNSIIEPEEADYEALFSALNNNKISKDSILKILSKLNETAIEELILYNGLIDTESLEKDIRIIVAKNKNLAHNAIIGRVMSKLKGKAEGKLIVEIVKKYIKN